MDANQNDLGIEVVVADWQMNVEEFNANGCLINGD